MVNRRYIIALILVFVIGCVAAFALRFYDVRKDTPDPIADAEVFDFTAGGFTLAAPRGSTMTEYLPPDGMLFSGMLSDGDQTLLLYCYQNEHGDNIGDYTDQALVTYYTHSGGLDVRMRVLGDRRFVCYSAQLTDGDDTHTWHVYETWDESRRLLIETQMSVEDALPILTTLSFGAGAL